MNDFQPSTPRAEGRTAEDVWRDSVLSVTRQARQPQKPQFNWWLLAAVIFSLFLWGAMFVWYIR